LEYGSETYSKLQDCFQGILFKLWGAPGSFRREDILVRRSPQGNDYIMFLQNNRSKSAVPAPGVTEKLANRVAFRIQTSLWEELLKSKENRILPDCLKVIPDISVGYATALNNPCEDTLEILNGVLEKSFEVAKLQQKRILDRQKEVMQTLIQNEGILYPNYQAVFKLSDLTKSQVEKVKEEKSIAPIANILMGFESLIRVKKELVEPLLRHDGLVYMDSNILRPDVLFQIAHATQISLELDQACLKQAIKMSGKLPGKLLVNILPRNLYYILSILPVQDFTKQIIFEISESESIQNFELIMKLTTQLKALNMSIATDDFGRGYAGLERVLRVQPELIKLDRSLIENIHLERSKRAYVKGLVEAALDSCSSVLAEGVELWQEAQVLQDMGVELIQGFLLHKPQPVEVILEDLGLESDEFSYLQQPSVA
jgi:EAL domain-containing protein (putative c-di-GMP-specific phosphodiesterase class I)